MSTIKSPPLGGGEGLHHSSQDMLDLKALFDSDKIGLPDVSVYDLMMRLASPE